MANNQTCQLADVRNSNELVFDVYKELSAVSLKSYINIQLTQMILKVTAEGDYIDDTVLTAVDCCKFDLILNFYSFSTKFFKVTPI